MLARVCYTEKERRKRERERTEKSEIVTGEIKERGSRAEKGAAAERRRKGREETEKDREKVKAWLKARRVLAMADDFQLLLSPSREWKMENPDVGIYIYIRPS